MASFDEDVNCIWTIPIVFCVLLMSLCFPPAYVSVQYQLNRNTSVVWQMTDRSMRVFCSANIWELSKSVYTYMNGSYRLCGKKTNKSFEHQYNLVWKLMVKTAKCNIPNKDISSLIYNSFAGWRYCSGLKKLGEARTITAEGGHSNNFFYLSR